MTNTTVNTIHNTNTAGMIRNHIGNKVEKMQEKKAVAKDRLHRTIGFLFSCESGNPFNLPADMKAKMYL